MKHSDYHNLSDNAFLGLPALGADVNPDTTDTALLDKAVLVMTNRERVRHGLKPFSFHPKLREMATCHSEQMRLHRFCGHENPAEGRYRTLGDRLEAVKDSHFAGFRCIGENIAQYPALKSGPTFFVVYDARGQPHCRDQDGKPLRPYTCLEYAEAVVKGWMDSPGHRANILNPDFEYIGCGCAGFARTDEGLSRNYFNLTQNFGGGEIHTNNKTTTCDGDTTPRPATTNNNAFGGLATKKNNIMKSKEDYIMDGAHTPENGVQKTQVVSVLDRSGSMGQTDASGESRISQLNEGIRLMLSQAIADVELSQMLEFCFIPFNHQACVFQKTTLAENITPPVLTASGGTDLAGAVNKGLDEIAEQKAYYVKHGISYNRPILLVMTDGEGNLDPVVKRAKEASDGKHAFILPVAIGDGANIEELKKIASDRVIKIKDGQIIAAFKYLSNSIGIIANATPDTKLPSDNPFETYAAE